MAIAIESQGQFAELLGILKKRRWQIILPICFGLALGAAVAVVLPKKYLIKTTVELRESRLASEANSRTPDRPSTSGEIVNAENHIKHFGRIKAVVEEQEWEEYVLLTSVEKQEFIEGVKDDLDVTVLAKRRDTGSTFMDIEYKASDPERGEAFLKRLSHLWVEEVVERERNLLSGEVAEIRDEVKAAEAAWRAASNEAKRLVQVGSLSPAEIDTNRDSGAEDPDFQRLVQLEDRLSELQGQVAGYDQAIAELDAAITDAPLLVPVDLVEGGLDLTKQIATARLELEKLRTKQAEYTTRNPLYHAIADKIEEGEEQIALLEASQRTAEVITEEQVNQDRVDMVDQRDQLGVQRALVVGQVQGLEDSIDGMRTKVAEKSDLMEQYYLAVKERELLYGTFEEARQAHDAKRRQLQALGALDGAFGSPYEFVQEALAPERPSEPQPALIIAIGLAVGLALGAGSAILAEFAKDGYRNAAELSRSMSLPILGVVDGIETRGQLRLRAVRRTVVGISSAVVIGGLLAFVWAWTSQPDLLPVELVDQLNAIRDSLR